MFEVWNSKVSQFSTELADVSKGIIWSYHCSRLSQWDEQYRSKNNSGKIKNEIFMYISTQVMATVWVWDNNSPTVVWPPILDTNEEGETKLVQWWILVQTPVSKLKCFKTPVFLPAVKRAFPEFSLWGGWWWSSNHSKDIPIPNRAKGYKQRWLTSDIIVRR